MNSRRTDSSCAAHRHFSYILRTYITDHRFDCRDVVHCIDTVKQLLDAAVSIEDGSRTTKRTRRTTSRESKMAAFRGRVIMDTEHPQRAIDDSRIYESTIESVMAFWVGTNVGQERYIGACACTVAYKKGGRWEHKRYNFDFSRHSLTRELHVIAVALNIACEWAEAAEHHFVIVHTTSTDALNFIKNTTLCPERSVLNSIIQLEQRLRDKGVELQLKWAPHHPDVEGIQVATAVACDSYLDVPIQS